MEARSERHIGFEGINNFRDFGGLNTRDGEYVPLGRLYRSGHHARATLADCARFAALGVAAAVDLREDSERREQPHAWLDLLSLELIADPGISRDRLMPIPRPAQHGADVTAREMEAFLATYYAAMPFDTRYMALFRQYFDRLASRNGPWLVHCSGGKDRTGVLVALTHHLLGVHPDDAMADYLLSNLVGNEEERARRVGRYMSRLYGMSFSPEAVIALLRVDPRYLESAWSVIADRCGSIDRYLVDVLGVDASKSDDIRKRLLR